MMHVSRYTLLWAALALPSAASATCQPSFVQAAGTITVRPSSLDDQYAAERMELRLRNDGDTPCSLRLVAARDLAASESDVPPYGLSGPVGAITPLASQVAGGQAGSATPIEIPAGGQIVVHHDVRFEAGWGTRAGDYFEELQFALLQAGDQTELASTRVRLHLAIPATARIRFAGDGRVGPARVEMGALSPTMPTHSPPFAIRVLSTSPYRMQLQSENAGALARIGGTDRAPYRIEVGGKALNLSGGGDGIMVNRHTSRTGDVHPVAITIEPDPLRHAGSYSDRVTVTVTPI